MTFCWGPNIMSAIELAPKREGDKESVTLTWKRDLMLVRITHLETHTVVEFLHPETKKPLPGKDSVKLNDSTCQLNILVGLPTTETAKDVI